MEKSKLIKQSNKDPTLGYSVVHRYAGSADVWYHDGSADAIMFQVDKQVLLGGVGIFSGANGALRGQIQVSVVISKQTNKYRTTKVPT